MAILNNYAEYDAVWFEQRFYEKVYGLAEIWTFMVIESEEFVRFND